MAHYLPAVGIGHQVQVAVALKGLDVGDVADPKLLRTIYHQVLCSVGVPVQPMSAVGGLYVPAFGCDQDALLAQDAEKLVPATFQPVGRKLPTDHAVQFAAPRPWQQLPFGLHGQEYLFGQALLFSLLFLLFVIGLTAVAKGSGYGRGFPVCPCRPIADDDRGKYFFRISVLNIPSARSMARLSISFSSSSRLILASSWEI